MKTVYIATKNKGKMDEFKTFFERFNIIVKSLLDIDQEINIEETGNSFVENALIKARTLCKYLNMPVLADDSGLEVEYLNNEPGIYSARYSGNNSNDLNNNLKLLEKLKGVPFEKRNARFVCALALVKSNGNETIVVGECKGYILEKMEGSDGFGYDPIFYLPQIKKTFAQLTREEKNIFSHRGNALKKLEKVLLDDKGNCVK